MNNSSTLILSTSTRGPSVAPAMSAIVAGSPVERRHCPALSLLTAVDTCKASSWAGTRSCPTRSAASIMPIFPHPLSRLVDVSPMISQRRARGPQRNLPRGPGCDTLPYQLIIPLLHCIFQKNPSQNIVDVLFFEIPDILVFLELLFFSDPFSCHRKQRHRRSGRRMGDCPADVSKRSPWKRRCGDDDVDRRERCTAVFFALISRMYSDDEKRNTAMRRETCPRSCSTLRSSGSRQRFRGCTCGTGYDDVSTTHRRTGATGWYRRVCAAQLTYWPNIIAIAI